MAWATQEEEATEEEETDSVAQGAAGKELVVSAVVAMAVEAALAMEATMVGGVVSADSWMAPVVEDREAVA